MSKKKRHERVELVRKTARVSIILLCLGGFSYQTMQFLYLYWAYPTVVDIQETSPAELDVPAITICNPIGYNYTRLCKHFSDGVCSKDVISGTLDGMILCLYHPEFCVHNQAPPYFKNIYFDKLMRLNYISYEDHDKLSMKLQDYMDCTIEFDGAEKSCNMENVMGSFYSTYDLPQYCYTIYSLWGQPDKKRDRIPRRAIMKLHFFLNATQRATEWLPMYKIPTTSPYVQIAVHSPYFLPSPYLKGSSCVVGKSYKMQVVTMSEKHLLAHPYQSNCTDYMKAWARKGGTGPINQQGVLQECRMKKYSEIFGCVPVNVDYPHTSRICNSSVFENADMTISENECSLITDQFNQPCVSVSYITKEEEKIILQTTYKNDSETGKIKEKRERISGHNCSAERVWRPECSTLDIEICFNTFLITNMTYNAKIESIELFSVIGGFMGMWLGISLLTIYDFTSSVLGYIKTWGLKKHLMMIPITKKNSVYPIKVKKG